MHEKNGIKFKLENKLNSIVEVDRDKEKIKKIKLETTKKSEIEDNKKNNNQNKSSFIYADMIIFSNENSANVVIIK